jgi:hypothetical protein
MPRQSVSKAQLDVATSWRARIKASHILNRLILCAEGELELTHTQANTGLRLVDKILPSLQAVTIEQTVQHLGLARHELDARLLALGQDPNKIWNRLGGVIDVKPEPIQINQDDHDRLHVDKHDQNQQPIEGTTPVSTESESSS